MIQLPSSILTAQFTHTQNYNVQQINKHVMSSPKASRYLSLSLCLVFCVLCGRGNTIAEFHTHNPQFTHSTLHCTFNSCLLGFISALALFTFSSTFTNFSPFKMDRVGEAGSCCEEKPAVVHVETIKNWPEYYRDYIYPKTRISGKMSRVGRSLYNVNKKINSKISLYSGDIANLKVDAVVNSSSSNLLGSIGVAGAICTAAGPELRETLSKSFCVLGDAIITQGFRLPAKYIIHTVGPSRGQERASTLLSNCYRNSLALFTDKKLDSIAFPCISTGAKGYPNKDAADIALREIRDFLEKNYSTVDRIVICVYLEKDRLVYEELIPEYFPVNVNKTSIEETESQKGFGTNENLEETTQKMDRKIDFLNREIAALRLENTQHLMKIEREIREIKNQRNFLNFS